MKSRGGLFFRFFKKEWSLFIARGGGGGGGGGFAAKQGEI